MSMKILQEINWLIYTKLQKKKWDHLNLKIKAMLMKVLSHYIMISNEYMLNNKNFCQRMKPFFNAIALIAIIM